jgi:uncharacterized protein
MNRNRRISSLFLLLCTIFLFTGKSFAENPQIPAPVGDIYVQDFADVLTQQEEMQIANYGRWIESETTAQIAVLTVETIGETTVEEFANEAFRQYGIGSESEDNGVLLLIGYEPSPGMTEKPLRIEVGYGLEGRLPDGKVGRILDEITIPYLKNDQNANAIVETYKVLGNEVLAEYGIEEGYQPVQQPAPSQVPNQTSAAVEDPGFGIPSWLLIIIAVIVIFLDFKYFGGFLTHIFLSILSRGGRGGGGGGSHGGGGGSSGGGGASRGW